MMGYGTLPTTAIASPRPLNPLVFMTKRPSNSATTSDFAEALKAWEEENPDAVVKASQPPLPSKTSAEGPLADALRKRRDAEALRAAQPKHSRTTDEHSAETQPSGPRSAQTRRMTEAALMREAFEAIDVDGFDPTSKYRGKGYSAAMNVELIEDAPAPEPTSRSSSEGVRQSYTSDDRAFEELMADADVQPLAGDVNKLRDAIQERATWERRSRVQEKLSIDALSQEELHAPTLTNAQRKLLKRAKKAGRLPELNLRHYRKAEALPMLANFVRAQQVHGVRFLRIITGKGKRSQDQAVIKPAVIEWCESPINSTMILDYTPDPDVSGDYGVVVLELRRLR